MHLTSEEMLKLRLAVSASAACRIGLCSLSYRPPLPVVSASAACRLESHSEVNLLIIWSFVHSLILPFFIFLPVSGCKDTSKRLLCQCLRRLSSMTYLTQHSTTLSPTIERVASSTSSRGLPAARLQCPVSFIILKQKVRYYVPTSTNKSGNMNGDFQSSQSFTASFFRARVNKVGKNATILRKMRVSCCISTHYVA